MFISAESFDFWLGLGFLAFGILGRAGYEVKFPGSFVIAVVVVLVPFPRVASLHQVYEDAV